VMPRTSWWCRPVTTVEPNKPISAQNARRIHPVAEPARMRAVDDVGDHMDVRIFVMGVSPSEPESSFPVAGSQQTDSRERADRGLVLEGDNRWLKVP